MNVGNKQSLTGFNLHCINQSTRFNEGILATGNAEVRLHNSQIAYTSSYCIDHQSSGYTEAYNTFLVGGAACNCSAGVANLYLCQTVGSINASNSSKIKHVDSFHAGTFTSSNSSTIWISGMQWAEEPGNDIQIVVNHSSEIVLANSRAKVITNGLNVVTVNSDTAKFKAMNSTIVNSGTGQTINGFPNVRVYLFYCVLNKEVVSVDATHQDTDSVYIVSGNVE